MSSFQSTLVDFFAFFSVALFFRWGGVLFVLSFYVISYGWLESKKKSSNL